MGELLAGLGAAPLYAQRAKDEAVDLVAAELVGTELDADVVFVQLYSDERAAYDAARAAGIFNGITAFRTGRVIELGDVDAQSLYFSSVLTVPWALGVLERELSRILAGPAAASPSPTATPAPGPPASPTPSA